MFSGWNRNLIRCVCMDSVYQAMDVTVQGEDTRRHIVVDVNPSQIDLTHIPIYPMFATPIRPITNRFLCREPDVDCSVTRCDSVTFATNY